MCVYKLVHARLDEYNNAMPVPAVLCYVAAAASAAAAVAAATKLLSSTHVVIHRRVLIDTLH